MELLGHSMGVKAVCLGPWADPRFPEHNALTAGPSLI